MATLNTTLTLASTDLTSDTLNLTATNSITISHTTGMSRETVTSTAKGTASGQVTLYTADDYAAIAYLYIKKLIFHKNDGHWTKNVCLWYI